MDVDLNEGCGLAGCARGAFDAETLQFYEADHVRLSGLQPAKQMLHRGGAYRSSPMILDRHFVVERQGREARRVSNAVDPLIACDRRYPCSEGSRWCVRVPLGVDRKKGILPRVFGCRERKTPRIVPSQPGVQFSKQLLVGLAFA